MAVSVIKRALNCFSKALKFVHYLWYSFMIRTIVNIIWQHWPRALNTIYASLKLALLEPTGLSSCEHQHEFLFLYRVVNPEQQTENYQRIHCRWNKTQLRTSRSLFVLLDAVAVRSIGFMSALYSHKPSSSSVFTRPWGSNPWCSQPLLERVPKSRTRPFTATLPNQWGRSTTLSVIR